MANKLPPPPNAKDGEQLVPRSLKTLMALKQGASSTGAHAGVLLTPSPCFEQGRAGRVRCARGLQRITKDYSPWYPRAAAKQLGTCVVTSRLGDLRSDQPARSNPTGKDGLNSAAGDAAGQPKKRGNKFKLAAAEEQQRGHDASAANRIGGAEDATTAAEPRYRPTA